MLKRPSFFALFLTLVTLLTATAAAELKPLGWNPYGGNPVKDANYLSANEYKDESIHVTLKEGVFDGTKYFVANVEIVSPTQLRTAAAGTKFDSTMVMNGTYLARRVNAVAAINGDYYSYYTDGYLIRQGTMYRNSPNVERDVLLIDDQGDFHIVCQATKEIISEDYGDLKIMNSFNFGPGLVVDGVKVSGFFDAGNAAFERKQRACIAQTGELSYFLLVCEGPHSGADVGLDLKSFAELAHKLGAQNAYNLDGGYSTMLIFNNKMVNDKVRTREISDIIYFATLVK